jgi:putative nucleotidyltransferase with HDIG domain
LASDFLTDRDAVLEILNIKNYDEFLFSHSINVAIVSLLIASKLSLEEGLVKTVGIAGLLHDIGKVKIPRELINKPEELSENEWTVVRRHPIEGAQILVRHENIGELPVLAALEHHAGYDLSGYPTLKGKRRPHAVARIVTIADVYEAMTANRSYRSARTICQTVKLLIDGAGRHFDPLLVKLLFNTIGAFPPGSMVRLKNGVKAVVVEPHVDHPFSPKVRIIGARTSDLEDAPLIDTAEDPARYAVVGVADSEEV